METPSSDISMTALPNIPALPQPMTSSMDSSSRHDAIFFVLCILPPVVQTHRYDRLFGEAAGFFFELRQESYKPATARIGTTKKMAIKGKKSKAAADIKSEHPLHADKPTTDIGTADTVRPQWKWLLVRGFEAAQTRSSASKTNRQPIIFLESITFIRLNPS
ncbi:MAG: hypothetical protein KJ964_08985 [Verrucomicrobia bacterium]|nr:hypothetical protein [Verrucomicrobiota bacterium]MBU1735161.1 hypothetical protein [Verrucomicrobiota bacterium]MBU1856434.1 hypothetical protein [Verrucomicrobiota bacterium]